MPNTQIFWHSKHSRSEGEGDRKEEKRETQKGFANNHHAYTPTHTTCVRLCCFGCFLFAWQIFHENCMNCRFLYARNALRLACASARLELPPPRPSSPHLSPPHLASLRVKLSCSFHFVVPVAVAAVACAAVIFMAGKQQQFYFSQQ